mmetsp:Transcript_37270/g.111603  ORF Transcript_37270/g.111603 Transcript_37270/m.111603 type:complete len:368 (+) Transcript_37270:3236-4339(+)
MSTNSATAASIPTSSSSSHITTCCTAIVSATTSIPSLVPAATTVATALLLARAFLLVLLFFIVVVLLVLVERLAQADAQRSGSARQAILSQAAPAVAGAGPSPTCPRRPGPTTDDSPATPASLHRRGAGAWAGANVVQIGGVELRAVFELSVDVPNRLGGAREGVLPYRPVPEGAERPHEPVRISPPAAKPLDGTGGVQVARGSSSAAPGAAAPSGRGVVIQVPRLVGVGGEIPHGDDGPAQRVEASGRGEGTRETLGEGAPAAVPLQVSRLVAGQHIWRTWSLQRAAAEGGLKGGTLGLGLGMGLGLRLLLRRRAGGRRLGAASASPLNLIGTGADNQLREAAAPVQVGRRHGCVSVGRLPRCGGK